MAGARVYTKCITRRCSIVPLRSTGQFLSCDFVVLLRKSIPQNHNLKTAAELSVILEKIMTNEELLIEIEDLLRSPPEAKTISHDLEENHSWLGRVSAVINVWNYVKTVSLDLNISRIHNSLDPKVPLGNIRRLLYEARHDLRMKTVGPVSIALAQGTVFDYFEEIRKIITLASNDILFIDPYMEGNFVARYLPHCQSGVTIRLLSEKKIPELVSSVDLFNTQYQKSIQVRSVAGLHDRYVIIDGASCYQSGASFKDGANKSPTTVTQITDAFLALKNTYEGYWNTAKVER
jgi:hypothetical protein